MRYLFDTNIVIYYFNGLTADESLHGSFPRSSVGTQPAPLQRCVLAATGIR